MPAILTVFLMAGVFQIIMGIAGIGKYIRYIPYPVVSGFMTAIGVMILITQIQPMLGYKADEDQALIERFSPKVDQSLIQKTLKEEGKDDLILMEDYERTIQDVKSLDDAAKQKEAVGLAKGYASGVIGTLKVLPNALKSIRWLEILLTLATIFIIYGFKRITTSIPSTLVALLVVSGIAYFAKLDYLPIEEIPAGLPEINWGIFTEFSFSSVTPYIFTAILLSFLGAIDSLLTSVVADNMTKTKHKPNKELVGQGIGNSIASLFGGIPGAGATIRTVVNINSGGKTRLSGMMAGVLLFVILLALGPVASEIPAAVLAGILITVGIGVMDYKGLKAIPNLPKDINIYGIKMSSEVLIMLTVLSLSVFWNLIYAVGIGLVISSLMFMRKMGDFTAEQSKVVDIKTAKTNEPLWGDEVNFPENLKEEIFIKHLSGPMFFGYTSEFQQLAGQIPKTATHVILRMDNVPYIDQSGVYAIEDTVLQMHQKGISTYIVGLQKQAKYMLERIDIIPDLIPEDNVFESFDDCISLLSTTVEDLY